MEHLKYERNKIVGFDVKYTDEPAHDQKASVVQLSIGKTQTVLLFQLSVAKDKCTTFDNFLLDPRYTFLGFSVDQDIKKLDRVDLEIAHFVDIQKELKVLKSTKYLDSLGDVSAILAHHYYIDMTHKMTNKDHRRWDRMPLSEKHIKYAEKDAYAAYEIWNHITLTLDGLRCKKIDKS
ncbi:putative exonuclease mut-7-like protein [Hordeum vulgare]|nr:putative exonuclease mut-7-like protein [Hordeum vulgare]